MVNLIKQLLPWAVLIFNIVEVIILFALISHKGWGKHVAQWVGQHALSLGFFVSLTAVLGSLFYSNIVGYEPCVLCWWQRIFIYPQPILFLTALKYKDRGVFKYIWRLSVIALVISLYHSYVYWGGESLLPCTALGGACSKIYVYAFGYITIPTMVLSIAVMMLLLSWANKIYENRHA